MQNYKTRYTIIGICFGFCFPILAIGIDIWRLGKSLTLENIIYVHTNFPIHYIIDTAPLFLGLFAFFGGVWQDRAYRINNRLREEMENLRVTRLERDRMEGELQVARDIQASMLPHRFPDRRDVDIFARLIPAKEVGGDFYDFYFIDNEHLCFAVGDVSGKGVPAALMMAVSKTWLRASVNATYSTAKIMNYLNNELAKNNDNYMFLTLFLGILNTKTGKLIYSNAGHSPTFIKRKGGKLQKLGDLHGPVLAAMENIQYTESKIVLEKEDMIFAYTDGVTEAHNISGELFSESRLSELLTSVKTIDAEGVVNEVVTAVHYFEEGKEAFDDVTALGIRFLGFTENERAPQDIPLETAMGY